MITTNQIHYVAGLLEGEGCFTYENTPIIILNMVDMDTVNKVRNIISPKSIIYKEDKGIDRKFQYRIRSHASQAIGWMMTLYPLMSIRRKEEIRKAISRWKDNMQRSVDNSICKHGHSNRILNLDFSYRLNGSKRCKHCRRFGVA